MEQEYRLHGDHPEDLDDGRTLEPGDFIRLSDEDLQQSRVASLIEDGKLWVISTQAPEATDAAKKIARARDIELTAVTATGSRGEITVDDVRNYIDSQERGGEEQ